MAQSGYLPIDPELLPTLQVPQESTKHGPITSGLARGVLDVIGGTLGAATAGAGKLIGSSTIENAGQAVEDFTQSAAPTYNRPDLEVAPWQQGGAHVAPWLEYQIAKQVPLIAAYVAGGKGLARAGVEAPEFLQQAAARVPRVLGGGGLRAGMEGAEREAALTAGKGFAQTALGAEAVGIPIAAGSMYQEAQNKPGGATRADAVKAGLLSPFYAALDAIEPAGLEGLVKRGLAGGVIKRAATAGLVGSAAEVVQEGVQTAMEQSFRTDLTPGQKFQNIVNAAVTGGAIGGVLGGGAAALGGGHNTSRAVKGIDPNQIQTTDIRGVVDQVLGLPAPGQVSGGVGPNDVVNVSPAGVAQPTSVNNSIYNEPIEDTSRPLRNFTDPELLSAHGVLIARDDLNDRQAKMLELAQQELQHRNLSASNTNVSNPTVEAVEPTGGNFGAPASTNTNIVELTKGLRLPASLKTALEGAANADEVQDIIHDHVIIQGKAGNNIDALAQRAGVLDNDGKPTPLADAISERKAGPATGAASVAAENVATAPAAPANSEGGDLSEPAKLSDKQLLEALAANNPKEVEADLPAVAAAALTDEAPQFNLKQRVDDVVQREARRRGLLSPVLSEAGKPVPGMYDYTDKARSMMQRNYNTPIPIEDTTAAATARGFKGAAASQFDRGAQAFVKGIPAQKLAEPAWRVGHEWAAALNAAPITHEETQAAIKNANLGDTESQSITSNEKVTGELNKQIDALGLTTTVHPSEVAQLKQMVRSGAPLETINKALDTVKQGGTLFSEPGRVAPEFKGEVVTRGLVNARQLAERQLAARTGEATQTLSKSARLKNDTALIQMHQRRQRISDIAQRFREERAAEQSKGQEVEELSSDTTAFTQRNRYRRGENGVISSRADMVREHVAALTKNWKAKQNVRVIEQLDQLPPDVQKVTRQGWRFTTLMASCVMAKSICWRRIYQISRRPPRRCTTKHSDTWGCTACSVTRWIVRLPRCTKPMRHCAKRSINGVRTIKGYYRNNDIALATEEVLAQRANNGTHHHWPAQQARNDNQGVRAPRRHQAELQRQ
jgi:hypothetical protein